MEAQRFRILPNKRERVANKQASWFYRKLAESRAELCKKLFGGLKKLGAIGFCISCCCSSCSMFGPASERASLSLSIYLSRLQTLPACLPACSLPLCLRTNPASNLEAHWFSGFNRASPASARSRLYNCVLIQPCVCCKRARSRLSNCVLIQHAGDGWNIGRMDGLIGGHSARCEISSGVSPYVFSERATWSTRMCPHQCSKWAAYLGRRYPINVLNEAGEIWEWVDQLTWEECVCLSNFKTGRLKWVCAQVLHNGQINFRMCAKNSIHANWVG